MARSYRSIVNDYCRRFPIQVRLENADSGRDAFMWWALQHFHFRIDWSFWYEDGVTIYGFTDPAIAIGFRIWSERCGIDWSVPHHLQPYHPP